MPFITLTQIWVYPVKSMRGSPVPVARITDRGLEHDRRWMLIDEDGKFISQRETPKLALFRPEIGEEGLYLADPEKEEILVPFHQGEITEKIRVKVWSSDCWGVPVPPEADQWLSDRLEQKVRLVYMPDFSHRRVDEKYARGDLNSFSDGFPYLLIGQASLDKLNSELPDPVPMNRFRPNLVVMGSGPFEEDEWADFQVGEALFNNAKPCARCLITTIDQQSGEKTGAEPLATLAKYRSQGNKVLFGVNLLCKSGTEIRVGDPITVISRK